MEKQISRRDLLKLIIAGSGGIAAAGFLPEKWLRPVVKSGVMPVHAQSSNQPDHNYVQGTGTFSQGWLYDDGFVSSEPFSLYGANPSKSAYKLASPNQIPSIEHPVEGVEVTLFVDDVEQAEKKISDQYGHVSWSINMFPPTDFAQQTDGYISLRFVITGDEDEYLIELAPEEN